MAIDLKQFADDKMQERVAEANAALRRGVSKLAPPPLPKAAEVSERVSSCVHNHAMEVKDLTLRKVKHATDHLAKGLPLLERAGYRLTAFDVEMGVPPKLIPRFAIREHIDQRQQEKLLAESRPDRIIHAVLAALFKANHLQQLICVGDLEMSEVSIEITTIPRVRVRFEDPREYEVVKTRD